VSELSYCAREVRRLDRDRYLATLFAPAEAREDLFALYAFNLEVARTAELVSEPMIGRIRLQWWRDCLEEIYDGRGRRHAVATPLAGAIRRRGLDRAEFDRLLEAREFDLDGEAPEDLAALESYAEATSASLIRLALDLLGQAPSEAARHLGIAWALTGLARAVPFHARQKRLYLPADLCATAGLDRQDLFELRSSPALQCVVEALAARAAEHLAAFRNARPPRAARPVLLLAPMAARHLALLRRAGHDPFDPRLQTAPTGSAWRLAWAALLRRY
jgi:phytoene synthase